MRTLIGVVALAAAAMPTQQSGAATLLNVAIPPPALGMDSLLVSVDGQSVGPLPYKEVVDLPRDGRRVEVFSSATNQLLASATLLRACNGANEPCSPLFVVFGGVNGRDLRIESVNDAVFSTGRRCTDISERCRNVMNLAPIARPRTGQDSVRYRQRCVRGLENASQSGLIAPAYYGDTNSGPGAEIAGRLPLRPIRCSLESVAQVASGLFWPEAHGLDIPPGTTGRFIIIGDAIHQPLEILAMIDTEVVEAPPLPIDPNVHLTSALIWVDPEKTGEGIFVQMHPDGSGMTAIQYFYDESGRPRWAYLALSQTSSEQGDHYAGQRYRVTQRDAGVGAAPEMDVEVLIAAKHIEVTAGNETRVYVSELPAPER